RQRDRKRDQNQHRGHEPPRAASEPKPHPDRIATTDLACRGEDVPEEVLHRSILRRRSGRRRSACSACSIPPVLAEDSLRARVPRLSVERGDRYYEEGRVSRIRSDSGVIEATVIGSRPYSVALILGDEERLIVDCECPFFEREFLPCKHIWAVIRAAGAKQLLPDHELGLEDNHFDNEPPVLRYGSKPSSWERFLQAVGPAPSASTPPRATPDEIAYVINPSSGGSHSLMLRILGRARRKNGEWGKWKPRSFRLDELQSLDAFDRESIALLSQHTY